MTRCEKYIYVAATTLDRRIGQKCAWCSFLSDEEVALAHAINAMKSSYKRHYPVSTNCIMCDIYRFSHSNNAAFAIREAKRNN